MGLCVGPVFTEALLFPFRIFLVPKPINGHLIHKGAKDPKWQYIEAGKA